MYRFLHDPGHGWLEVPYSEVVELGLRNKITAYSYQNVRHGHITLEHGQKEFIPMVYLEEDRDMRTFMEAKYKDSTRPVFKEIYHEDDQVRGLDCYNPDKLEKWIKK